MIQAWMNTLSKMILGYMTPETCFNIGAFIITIYKKI
jgi:hypothetical protein